MTEPTGDAPLSRRELREQRRRAETAAGHVVSSAATNSADEPRAAVADREQRVPVTTPPSDSPMQSASVTPAPSAAPSSSGHRAPQSLGESAAAPLTRRQLRDLERQRTSGISVVDGAPAEDTADQDDEPRAAAAPSVPARPQLPMPVTFARGAEHTPAREREPERSETGASTPGSVKAQPQAAAPPAQSATPAQPDADSTLSDDSTTIEELIADAPHPAADSPTVSDAFGRHINVAADPAAADKSVKDVVGTAFDALITDAGSGSTTATHALILPSVPSSTGLGQALTENGGVVLTGSIDLPRELSTTGQHPNYFEKPELDAMFDGDEDPQANTGSSPVSAARAISTHTAARDLIAPPAPQKNSRLLLTLSITAGVLAVSVLAVVIVGLVNGSL